MVDRDGKILRIDATPKRDATGGKLMVTLVWDTGRPVIAGVAPGHPAAERHYPRIGNCRD